MLETREEEASPEVVDREKYDMVRQRQEERRTETVEPQRRTVSTYPGGMKRMRISTAAVFGVLCLVGLGMLWDEQEVVSPGAQNSTLIAQDKLTDAVLAENAIVQTPAPTVIPTITPAPVEVTPTTQPVAMATPVVTPTPEPMVTPTPVATPVPTAEPVKETMKATAAYIIQKGDSLTAICIRQYGDDELLEEVCELNGIENPDDIKVGEKILLP